MANVKKVVLVRHSSAQTTHMRMREKLFAGRPIKKRGPARTNQPKQNAPQSLTESYLIFLQLSRLFRCSELVVVVVDSFFLAFLLFFDKFASMAIF